MADNNLAVAEKIVFTEYPEEMDKYFQDRKLVVKTFPNKFEHLREAEFPDIEITSARQLYEFIEEELKFWGDKDIQNKSFISIFYTKLINAKNFFNSSKMYYESNQAANAKPEMINLYGQFTNEYLYSKTKLAQFIKQYKANDHYFFEGLKIALWANSANPFPDNYVGTHIGFAIGLEYLKVVQTARAMAKEELDKFLENVKIASDSYAELNKRYTASFHEQKNRIEEIKRQNDDAIKNLETKSTVYFDERDKRCADLENLYEDKLRIEKPADYWKLMSEMYAKKGKVWLIAGCLLAGLIIAMLICIIIFVPNIFDADSHWFDILKNSAIVTVIAGVAIYVLRIFVKMALSSFHLGRDAKEREQLSYYYLSLIEGKAITDRERALIINSLFSRSDTGLLKGEAAPTMATNISDIIETVTKK